MNLKRWHIRPPAPAEHLARFPDLPPILVQVLYHRGLCEPADVRAFLDGSIPYGDPFRLRGMHAAVTRLRRAIQRGELIAIYGDFDVDGVTATALLVQTLSSLGARVRPYIPHRVDEGYGLNSWALEELAKAGIQIVLTVDCGVRSIEEALVAQRLGLDLIITDHHTPGDQLPTACAVVNPRQPGCRYGYDGLAGVGLAFKLAQALLRVQKQVPLPLQRIVLAEDDLLDLVALGTVVDMAPLVGENRMLVQRGLRRLNQPHRPGLISLMQVAGIQPGQINGESLSFVIGPRLNAAGRLEHALSAYELLMCQSLEEAGELARKLDEQNRRRQELTQATLDSARTQIEAQLPDARLLFVAGEDYLPGIVGLVASKLTEEYYRPAVVVEVGPEQSRGSARSIPEFNIVQALDACADLLIRHGGHARAAGFTILTKDLLALQARLQALAAEQLRDVDLMPSLEIDAELPLRQGMWSVHEALSRLAPFGTGNPAPLLLTRGAIVRERRVVGNNHLKLLLSDGLAVWDAIAFRQAGWLTDLPRRIDVVYTLEVNEWNGEKQLQLNVQDLRPAA